MLDSSLQSAAGSMGAIVTFFLLSWGFCQGFETSATTGDAARSYFTQVFRSVFSGRGLLMSSVSASIEIYIFFSYPLCT